MPELRRAAHQIIKKLEVEGLVGALAEFRKK
jgi:hypothetical protein